MFFILFERILEVNPSCRDETIIRKAYLEKVKQYHPDSPRQDNKGDHQKFNQIQEAYEALLVKPQSLFCHKVTCSSMVRKRSNLINLLHNNQHQRTMIFILNSIFVIQLHSIEHI